MTRDRRQTRIDRARTGNTSAEPAPNLVPPSPDLMDHLWDTFGDRPQAEDLMEARRPLEAALSVMSWQSGREEVLRYLDELMQKANGL